MGDLSDLHETVRRVVAARVFDPPTVEDLVQETFVRMAAAEHRLADEALLAYAIVTARNLTISHARTRSVHDRNAHRLVDYTSLDGPEEITLQRSETDALSAALGTLEPHEREILLRHEVDGTTIKELGDEMGVSTGGVTMRLARARSTLRLEFLLAFRHVDLPTARCRPILLALSAGDRRRQLALDAPAHLLGCPTCADLVEPVTERRRAIAVWLIGPVALLARLFRTRRSVQLAVATAVVGALVAGVVVVDARRSETGGAPPVSASPEPSTGASGAGVVVASTDAPTTSVTATAPATTVATSDAARCPANPLVDPPNPAIDGCALPTVTLTVTRVTADEAFVAGGDDGVVVWVMLTGTGESGFTIRDGSTVTLTASHTSTTLDDPAFGTPPSDYDLAVEVSYADVEVA